MHPGSHSKVITPQHIQESTQALAGWHKHLKQPGHHWTKVVFWRTSCMRSLVDLVAGTKSSELLSTSPKGHSAFDGQWMFIIPNQIPLMKGSA